jgi:hypothetical protein
MWFAALVGVVYAWAPTPERVVASPVPVRALALVEIDGSAWWVVTGPKGTALLDGDGAVHGTLDRPASGVVARADEGVTALFFCTTDGVIAYSVSASGFGAPTPLTSGRCGAIAEDLDSDPETLWVAGDGVWRVPIGDAVAAPVDASGAPRSAVASRQFDGAWTQPLLAWRGDRVAVAEAGATEIIEVGPWGRSTFHTDGPIADLDYGSEGLAWIIGTPSTTSDATRRATPIAAQPGALETAALAGPGRADRVVTHLTIPPMFGVIPRNGVESLYPAPATPAALLVDDVDLDGCVDVVIGGETSLWIRTGQCEPELTQAAPQRPNIPQPVPIILNHNQPALLTRVGEEYWGQLYFPDGRRRVWSVRGAPDGLMVLPDGLVRYTPRPDQVGRHELYVRANSITQKLAVVVLPAVHGGAPTPPSAPAPAPPPAREPPPAARRCLVGLGFAAGGSYSVADWRQVGDGPLRLSASPAAMISCDSSLGPVRAFFGFDTAPTFSYSPIPNLSVPHLAAMTAGVSFGGKKLRIGPYGTIGLVVLGVGARVTWLPFERRTATADGRRARPEWGFELRATGFIPSTPAGEVALFAVWRN